MPGFENGQWYQGAVADVEYIKSEKKETPAIQLTVDVPDHGVIVGQWWLTDTLVKNPLNKNEQVPQWQAALNRCLSYGCNEDALRAEGWIEHMRQTIIGQTAAVFAEVNSYGDVKAQFVGKPKGKGGGGYAKQTASASPFADRTRAGSAWDAADDDVPF
jgi:hypothetical protein